MAPAIRSFSGLTRTAIAALFLLLPGCSGSPGGTVVPAATQTAARTSQGAIADPIGARAIPIGARAIPIGARAIPIGARAIPIGARAIPINFTQAPQVAPVCGGGLLGGTLCTAVRRLDVVPGVNLLADLIPGFQPSDLQNAYNLPPGGGAGRTIGIVVAYHNPNAAADLAVYRSTFGLPECSVQSGCLRFASSDATAKAPGDVAWGQEVSIDLDMASAVCPACNLLVVEAPNADIDNLTAAMQTAVRLGANVVSNSYSTPETAAVAAQNALWNHPGTPIVAGAGDNGYGVSWPAASSYVTAVGGTTILPVLNGFAWLELAWGKTGSGCSAYIAKPSWQHDAFCQKRAVADVSAVADPVPGVAVYDTYFDNSADQGWNVYGGTSVATPIIAGMYALAPDSGRISNASTVYAHAASFNDIILGANGLCLSYLCTAVGGYDGPTGVGTPNGIAGF